MSRRRALRRPRSAVCVGGHSGSCGDSTEPPPPFPGPPATGAVSALALPRRHFSTGLYVSPRVADGVVYAGS